MQSSKESLTLPRNKSPRAKPRKRNISKKQSILDICSVKEGGNNKNSKANLDKTLPNDSKNAQNSGANIVNAAEKTRDSAEMNADIGFLIEKKRSITRK